MKRTSDVQPYGFKCVIKFSLKGTLTLSTYCAWVYMYRPFDFKSTNLDFKLYFDEHSSYILPHGQLQQFDYTLKIEIVGTYCEPILSVFKYCSFNKQ